MPAATAAWGTNEASSRFAVSELCEEATDRASRFSEALERNLLRDLLSAIVKLYSRPDDAPPDKGGGSYVPSLTDCNPDDTLPIPRAGLDPDADSAERNYPSWCLVLRLTPVPEPFFALLRLFPAFSEFCRR